MYKKKEEWEIKFCKECPCLSHDYTNVYESTYYCNLMMTEITDIDTRHGDCLLNNITLKGV